MDNKTAISVVSEFADVETALQTVETICGYATDKTPVKKALQEIFVMSDETPKTIDESFDRIMDVIGGVYQTTMTAFNEETDSEIDTIDLKPFKERYDQEVKTEHGALKAMSARVIEMAGEMALGFGFVIPVPTYTAAAQKPKKSLLKSLRSLVVVDEAAGSRKNGETPSWLTEAVLNEADKDVQQFLLSYNKFNETKSIDAVRTFAAKFKKDDEAIKALILDIAEEAYAQAALSDQIIANVTASFQKTAKVITVLLAKRDEVLTAKAYITGK